MPLFAISVRMGKLLNYRKYQHLRLAHLISAESFTLPGVSFELYNYYNKVFVLVVKTFSEFLSKMFLRKKTWDLSCVTINKNLGFATQLTGTKVTCNTFGYNITPFVSSWPTNVITSVVY